MTASRPNAQVRPSRGSKMKDAFTVVLTHTKKSWLQAYVREVGGGFI